MIYFIESGQVKLLLASREGKQCLASIRTAGDIFGEPCLSGQSQRLEMAVAMKETCLKKLSARNFVNRIKSNSMLETFVQYLAVKVSEQMEIISALTTDDSEHLLGKTLLYLGGLLGTPNSGIVCIPQRISHEELSRRTQEGVNPTRYS
jgi:CRP-like cAMP-binding protein